MKAEKILAKLLSGSKNIRFKDVLLLLESLDFSLSRTSGSHYIYVHSKVPELVNIQNVKGQVKPYQTRQILILIEKYDLKLGEK